MLRIVASEESEQEGLKLDLDALVREGARRMLPAALKAEADEYIAEHADHRDDDGHALVVRNGVAEPRTVTTAAGALEEPLRQLVRNAGLEGSVVAEELRRNSAQPSWGFDVMTEQYCDLVEAGVIDPAKATRTALENAASVGGMILTTEALVAEAPEKEVKAAAAAGAGAFD
jgi:TCP-1/cpn60 chaperonin family protein